jgi:hypothetical protein
MNKDILIQLSAKIMSKMYHQVWENIQREYFNKVWNELDNVYNASVVQVCMHVIEEMKVKL